MAPKRQENPAQRPLRRLYLIAPLIEDTLAFADELGAVLDAGDIAALLVRCAPTDEATCCRRIEPLRPIVQSREIALLVDGPPELVIQAGADGAHVDRIDTLKSAITRLKPAYIVGAGGLVSRHEAMLAGEAGADYVMFGEPDAAGRRPGFEAVLERVAWWAEVFQPPCVGFATSLDEVAALASAGADFVAVGDELIWSEPRGAAAGLGAAAARLSASEAVA